MANILIKQGKEIAGSSLVNPSTKADKVDLSNIIQTGTTSSRVISAGKYFYLNDVLVRAKVVIASGATFTLNTNYEIVSAGALNELNDAINRGSITIKANGSKTNEQALNELFALIDSTKISGKSYLQKGTEIFQIYFISSTTYSFVVTIINSSNTYTLYQLTARATGSQILRLLNGSYGNLSTNVLSSDLTLVY